jgi:hypothetical protein
MGMTKRDAWITLMVGATRNADEIQDIVEKAWTLYPDKARAKKSATPAYILGKKIGSGIGVCGQQIRALKEAGPYWTAERIMEAVESAQAHESPWEWKNRVIRESNTKNVSASTVQDFNAAAKAQAERIARGE